MLERRSLESELEALGVLHEGPTAGAAESPRSIAGTSFAPDPAPGSYWPVVSSARQGRLVSYQTASGKLVGVKGRHFHADRGARYHVGVDLFASLGDPIVACEDGQIVGFIRYFLSDKEKKRYTSAILVRHAGVTINYGEVAPESLVRHGLKVGSEMRAGQQIGTAGLNPGGSTMLHFETYRNGLTGNQRWFQGEAAPSHLLDPTSYLFALQRDGLGATASGAVGSPAQPSGGPEPIRWAQAILNRVAGAGLDVDGIRGKLTTAAIKAFQSRQGLASSGALDEATVVALVQRALEEIARQSLFATVGVLDDRTREVIAAFRSTRGLGGDGIDEALREALLQALAGGVVAAPAQAAAAPAAPASAQSHAPAGAQPPTDPAVYRTFRLTGYWVANEADNPVKDVSVPLYGDDRSEIARVSPAFFAKASLEGTGSLLGGRLVNVTGKLVPADPDAFASVLAYHRKYLPKKPPRYSGLVVENERVVKVLAFHVVSEKRKGLGYGILRGIPLAPFRTLAADLGAYASSEPKYRKKGGLVPAGTRVFIRELVGKRLPDGTVHDGWFLVNDTGGGIFGAHFDVFTGSRSDALAVGIPSQGTVWFEGIEQRISIGYSYGLKG